MSEIKRFYQQKVIIKKKNTNKKAKLKTKQKNKFNYKHITKISPQVSSTFVKHFEAYFRPKFMVIPFTS